MREALRDWVVIYLKGFCMGAADIVPGVSGGTIALITGIYERLIAAIAALDPRILGQVRGLHTDDGRRHLIETLARIDLPFLLALGAGIVTAFLLMSRVITALFELYPAQLSGFFFGLMAASAVVIYRDVPVARPRTAIAGATGIVIAFVLSGSFAPGSAGSLPAVFVAGAIAISAMVLPGISGAAFLYILGQYHYMLGALTDLTDAVVGLARGGSFAAAVEPGIVVGTFVIGAVIGLLTMARVVKWALARYRLATLSFLTGLIVGALRLPVHEATIHTAEWTPALLAGTVLAAAVGAAAVLALDRYTGSLDYA